ncbi:Plasma membrane t-SNARE, secretory vesicle fusion [Apophysomyces ossiformis]|uniref:Plasma membrane t-SNARE, secretory vesicle fusion n=1 Tax=Apophysomyces ossiformis TaxID=679940 RepID=A0A8H7BQT4_9FUNG|nr:Plasma membrane t-SNARE, secretory vesicle fusion [Apophysomyces ossiformis]
MVIQTMHLRKRFLELIKRYQDIERTYQTKYRQHVERQIRIVKPDATQDEIDNVIESDQPPQIFSQSLMQASRRGEASSVLSEVQSRHDDIKRIERTIVELHQLFMDMSMLVENQGVVLGQIQNSAEDTTRNLEQGNRFIGKAIQSARSTRAVFRLFQRQNTKQRSVNANDHLHHHPRSRKTSMRLSRLWTGRGQAALQPNSEESESTIPIPPCLVSIASEKLEVDSTAFVRSTSATSSSTAEPFWNDSTISTICTSVDGDSIKYQRFSAPYNNTSTFHRDLRHSQIVNNKSASRSRRVTTSCIGLAEQVRFILGDAISQADQELEDSLA